MKRNSVGVVWYNTLLVVKSSYKVLVNYELIGTYGVNFS